MRRLLIVLVLGSTLGSFARAADAPSAEAAGAAAPAAPVGQQDKMKQCNAQAKGKHGAERREFMSRCLSKKPKG